jgi:hypothetical protein
MGRPFHPNGANAVPPSVLPEENPKIPLLEIASFMPKKGYSLSSSTMLGVARRPRRLGSKMGDEMAGQEVIRGEDAVLTRRRNPRNAGSGGNQFPNVV